MREYLAIPKKAQDHAESIALQIEYYKRGEKEFCTISNYNDYDAIAQGIINTHDKDYIFYKPSQDFLKQIVPLQGTYDMIADEDFELYENYPDTYDELLKTLESKIEEFEKIFIAELEKEYLKMIKEQTAWEGK